MVCKVDVKFEIAALIWSVLRPNNVYRPLSEFVTNQANCYALNGLIYIQIIEFLHNSVLVQSVIPTKVGLFYSFLFKITILTLVRK